MLLDGQSYSMLIREAFDCYEALWQGKLLALPSPPPYKDFTAWLRSHQHAQANRVETFWRAQLQGFVSPTALPSTAPQLLLRAQRRAGAPPAYLGARWRTTLPGSSLAGHSLRSAPSSRR